MADGLIAGDGNDTGERRSLRLDKDFGFVPLSPCPLVRLGIWDLGFGIFNVRHLELAFELEAAELTGGRARGVVFALGVKAGHRVTVL